MQSLLKETSFLFVLHSKLHSRAIKCLSPCVHWAPREDKDSNLRQHAQGMASMKPVSARCGCWAEDGPILLC